ncbi:hypothetical protein LNQ81_10365 [Myroides sp. M-43]|uniref:hypothetical protein n=1 Tax=Myroides oncorhynchi TaxID=2893756 RepID=UPI001E2BC377|nr:hypothetical protein [Myroides oncorhynchi]MCC9043078.1 hypothetical protein [Myroides oncorhynchi]
MELMSDEGLRMDGDRTVIKEIDVERLYFKLNYYQSITKYWVYNYRKTKYLNYSLFLNQEFFFINYKN